MLYVITFQTQEIDLWTPKKVLYSNLNGYLIYNHNMEKKKLKPKNIQNLKGVKIVFMDNYFGCYEAYSVILCPDTNLLK